MQELTVNSRQLNIESENLERLVEQTVSAFKVLWEWNWNVHFCKICEIYSWQVVLKNQCGPWKSLKIVAFICLNPVKGLCHNDTEFYIFWSKLIWIYKQVFSVIFSPAWTSTRKILSDSRKRKHGQVLDIFRQGRPSLTWKSWPNFLKLQSVSILAIESQRLTLAVKVKI